MPKLEIVLANPEALQINRPGVTWFLTGCSENDAQRLQRLGKECTELEAQICSRVGDATIIKVISHNGQAVSVSAWRGPTSAYEIFRLAKENGDIILADHYRSITSCLDYQDRELNEDSIVDHFLFRSVPGCATHYQNIRRLGHGDRFAFDLVSRQTLDNIFQKLDVHTEQSTESEYLDMIDGCVDQTLENFKTKDDAVVLFSGGIDSTLLHTYTSDKTKALNLQVNVRSNESDMEAKYARLSADLLGIALDTQEVSDSSFLADLELVTELSAAPTFKAMLAVFANAFSSPYRHYISGWSADTLFGSATRYNEIASMFANDLLINVLELVAPLVSRKDKVVRNVLRERLEKLLPAAKRLYEDPASLCGFAARCDTYTEFELAERLFGSETVAHRIANRLDYLIERVSLKTPQENKFYRHLEVGSLMGLLCGCFPNQLRHISAAHGKSVVLPFVSGAVVRGALRIPAEERFIRNHEGKYILKSLLKRRVPDYPTGQRKGNTALVNFPQCYKTGVLARIWNEYEVPDFIVGETREKIISSPLNMTYSAIAFAIWKRRVYENTNLTPLFNGKKYEWPYQQELTTVA